MMIVLHTTGTGIVPTIIRRKTWHWVSHNAITDERRERVWECSHDIGVKEMSWFRWESRHPDGHEEHPIDVDPSIVIPRLRSKEGYPYDYLGVFVGQLFNVDFEEKEKLFCSEYVSWAINYDHLFFPHDRYNRIHTRALHNATYSHSRAKGYLYDSTR